MTLECNNRQREAIEHNEGNLLIIAGPGTGKTHTITHKIAHIISEFQLDPNNLVALTFTNRAAEEMKDRVSKLISPPQDDDRVLPFIGTFHSFCLSILRKHKFDSKIVSEKDQKEIISKISSSIINKVSKKNINEIQKIISLCKNECGEVDNFKPPHEVSLEDLSKVYFEYNEYLHSNKIFDFDDIITKTLLVLDANEKLKKTIQEELHFLFIDEYQDVNEAQYRLVKEIIEPDVTSICAIGDPDQSIYSFRGSNNKHFFRFPHDFGNTKIINLENNYRSSKVIIKAAQSLIQNNVPVFEKNLYSENKDGQLIVQMHESNTWKEADTIVKEIGNLIGGADRNHIDTSKDNFSERSNYNFSDFAVLYRTQSQGKILEDAFKKSGIPFQRIGSKPWHQSVEVHYVLNYIDVILHPTENVHWLNIIQNICPKAEKILKKISEEQSTPILLLLHRIDSLTELNKKEKEVLSKITAQLMNAQRDIPNMPTSQALNCIIEHFGIEDYIRDGSNTGEKKYKNILLLSSTAHSFDHQKGFQGLYSLREYFSLLKNEDATQGDIQAVYLMTLHAAKGLEFPVVFIAGLQDGNIPYKKKDEEMNVEEERRLFYVGMTRAKDLLYVSYANDDQKPSRFLKEIPSEFIEIKQNEQKKSQRRKKTNQLSFL